MKKMSTVIIMLFLGLCVSTPTIAPKATAQPSVTESRISAGPAEGWDRLVTEAKKEGIVSIYGGSLGEVRLALSEAFKQKYGISLKSLLEKAGN